MIASTAHKPARHHNAWLSDDIFCSKEIPIGRQLSEGVLQASTGEKKYYVKGSKHTPGIPKATPPAEFFQTIFSKCVGVGFSNGKFQSFASNATPVAGTITRNIVEDGTSILDDREYLDLKDLKDPKPFGTGGHVERTKRHQF